jgi:DNA-binding winged helix-turn-helix (wHTH) protein/TolB-like protein
MPKLHFANLRLSTEDGRISGPGGSESLRPQAARLLHYLLERPGRVIPREELYEAVWGTDAVVDFEAGLAALIRELRQTTRALDGPENLIETVPRRGYRLNARIVEPDRQGRRDRRNMRLVILLLLMLAVAVAAWILFETRPVEETPVAEATPSLAILPFEVYEATEGLPAHVELLLADSLLAELLQRRLDGLEMIGRTSLRPYVDREDVVSAVARDLGVELLIEGALIPGDDGGWQAGIRLLAVPPGRVLWSSSERVPADAPLDVESLAGSMADALARAWPRLRAELADVEPD